MTICISDAYLQASFEDKKITMNSRNQPLLRKFSIIGSCIHCPSTLLCIFKGGNLQWLSSVIWNTMSKNHLPIYLSFARLKATTNFLQKLFKMIHDHYSRRNFQMKSPFLVATWLADQKIIFLVRTLLVFITR